MFERAQESMLGWLFSAVLSNFSKQIFSKSRRCRGQILCINIAFFCRNCKFLGRKKNFLNVNIGPRWRTARIRIFTKAAGEEDEATAASTTTQQVSSSHFFSSSLIVSIKSCSCRLSLVRVDHVLSVSIKFVCVDQVLFVSIKSCLCRSSLVWVDQVLFLLHTWSSYWTVFCSLTKTCFQNGRPFPAFLLKAVAQQVTIWNLNHHLPTLSLDLGSLVINSLLIAT
jgi:hypothetical protein